MKNVLFRAPQDYGIKVLSENADGSVVFDSNYPMFGVDIRNAAAFKTVKININSITNARPAMQATTGYYVQEFTLATIPHGLGKVPAYYAFFDIENDDVSFICKAYFDVRKTEDFNAGGYPATWAGQVNSSSGTGHDLYQYPHYGKDLMLLNGAGLGMGTYVTPFTQKDDYHYDNTTNARQSESLYCLVYLEADEENIYVKIKVPYWVNRDWTDAWFKRTGSGTTDYIFYMYQGTVMEWVSLVGTSLTLSLFVTPY